MSFSLVDIVAGLIGNSVNVEIIPEGRVLFSKTYSFDWKKLSHPLQWGNGIMITILDSDIGSCRWDSLKWVVIGSSANHHKKFFAEIKKRDGNEAVRLGGCGREHGSRQMAVLPYRRR